MILFRRGEAAYSPPPFELLEQKSKRSGAKGSFWPVSLNAYTCFARADEAANRRIAARYLTRVGVPPEGIILLDSAFALEEYLLSCSMPPGVVFLDNIMPEKTGLEAMADLKAAGVIVPVVAMTGNVDKASR